MSKPTAVLFCPGRGSYTKAELGFVGRTLRAGPVADALAASDQARREQGRPTLTEVDGRLERRAASHQAPAITPTKARPNESAYALRRLARSESNSATRIPRARVS